MKLIEKAKETSKELKRDIKAIYFAYKRPELPWYTKTLAAVVVGYALSPIDLIPDFIPILGYLDDLVLIPLGIYFVVKLIPEDIMDQCRVQSEESFKNSKPKGWIAGSVIALLWIFIIFAIALKIFKK